MAVIKSDQLWEQQYRSKRDADLEQIRFELEVHEKMIQELIEDVKAYIEEHYDGKEER